MAFKLLGLLALLALLGLWWWWSRSSAGTPRHGTRPPEPTPAPAHPAARTAATPTTLAATLTMPLPMEPAVERTVLLTAADIAELRERTPPMPLPLHPVEILDPLLTEPLMEALRQLPRPPRALHELMDAEFVHRASSTELATLVLGEPTVAARVIATANSPLFGLQQPVGSIGQATTFLGLLSVRQMCLQHMLAACFQPRDAAQRREFDRLWHASNIAAELCQQLATRLRLPDAANLTTLLVLSFLGRQAAAALLPDAELLAHLNVYERAVHEQKELGLAAHELGHLLMRAWDLPFDLLQDARTVGSLRFDPDLRLAPEREAGLTLCTLCAMLGERIAGGDLADPLFDPLHDPRPDMQALRHRLALPALAGLSAELRSAPLQRLLDRLTGHAVQTTM